MAEALDMCFIQRVHSSIRRQWCQVTKTSYSRLMHHRQFVIQWLHIDSEQRFLSIENNKLNTSIPRPPHFGWSS